MDTDNSKDDPWIIAKAAAGFGALLVFIGLVTYLNRSPEPTELEKRAEQERAVQTVKADQLAEHEAPLIVEAKTAVLRRLRDPDSAEFGNAVVRYCKDLDCKEGNPAHGSPVVCMGVNAKNGFGGYTGYQTYILFSATHKIITPDMLTGQALMLAGKVCLD